MSQARLVRARSIIGALCERYGIEPAEPLIDGLFVPVQDRDEWLVGVSELSVSFRATGPTTVRALSEVLHKRRLDPVVASASEAWGTALLRRAGEQAQAPYATEAFRELFDLVYARSVESPPPAFRFGISIELGHTAPIVKTYFDLHAIEAARRSAALESIARLLGETAGLVAFRRACPGLDPGTGRIVGVDFGADETVRSKFYWSARRLDWHRIAATASEVAGDDHVRVIRRLEGRLAGVPDALSSVLVSSCGDGGRRSMKVDVCVARLYADDERAAEFVDHVLDGAGPAPLGIVAGDERTAGVHQYVGVELAPGHGRRVTVYYRPVGFVSDHLNPTLHPRRLG